MNSIIGKKGLGAAIIGYDLGHLYSQISYCSVNGGEPETVSAVMGTEQYNIPTALCKRKGVGQWFYGKEALKYAEQEDGILLENIYELALIGEQVQIDDESFDPIALLTLFVKRSLSLLSMEIKPADMESFMFTVENLDIRTVEVLGAVAVGLRIAPERVFFQSYRESIYQYMVHQPKELWIHQVLIFDYSNYLKAYLLESNNRTTPKVVFVEKLEFPQMTGGVCSEEQKAERDLRFLEISEQMCRDRIISTVYLLGDGFKENWAEGSIKFLCRGRRVFQGNNLYSKGACYGAQEKRTPSEINSTQVFLGEDKLKANIGMKVLRQGIESYYAILDAGMNWYEVRSQYEVILDEGKQLFFIVTSLTGGVVIEEELILEGLPERPGRTTRLLIQLKMISSNAVQVTVTDMGFGELFSTSDKKWIQEFTVS